VKTKESWEVWRIPVQEALGWQIKGSLRETLQDEAYYEAELYRKEREFDQRGHDFWRDRELVVAVDEADFVVHLVVEKEVAG